MYLNMKIHISDQAMDMSLQWIEISGQSFFKILILIEDRLDKIWTTHVFEQLAKWFEDGPEWWLKQSKVQVCNTKASQGAKLLFGDK